VREWDEEATTLQLSCLVSGNRSFAAFQCDSVVMIEIGGMAIFTDDNLNREKRVQWIMF
jgi:hypothetical protein